MKKHVVYIESVGDPITKEGPVAHVPALPGATARGATIEEAKENIRQAVADYLDLLRNVGEAVPKASEEIEFEFEIVERTTFPSDYDPLYPNELETIFRWMAVSRQELMDILRSLPPEAQDWKLEESLETLRDILCHLAEADLWYTDRLKQWPEAPLYRLAATRGVALERLRALKFEDTAKITRYEGQEWTPRKIIRRMLEHEREHLAQIKKLIEAHGG